MSTTAVNPSTSALPQTTDPSAAKKTASPLDPLANEQTFLKLLVSQLKNQDPLSPTDSTQFVSQLTSYSQLEQLIGIRKNTTLEDPAQTDQTTIPTTENK